MATNAIWSKKSSSRSAPCTIFSTTTLSPRQIANKAYSLGCKKLDRDDKRSKQKYHVRERLLILNAIAKAEEVLNARTKRTNRRVMDAEEEEEHEFTMKQHVYTHSSDSSPLRALANEEEEEEEEEEKEEIPTCNISQSPPPLSPRDCRIVITTTTRSNNNNKAMTTII